jgi:hypothetical protein
MSIYERFEQHKDKTFRMARERYLRDFQGKDVVRVTAALDAVSPYVDHRVLIDVDDEALEQFKFDRFHGRGHFEGRPAMAGTVNKEITQVSTVMHRAAGLWRWIPWAPKFQGVDGPARIGYALSWDEQDRAHCQTSCGCRPTPNSSPCGATPSCCARFRWQPNVHASLHKHTIRCWHFWRRRLRASDRRLCAACFLLTYRGCA